jgi:hypothetical protein
LTCAAAPTDSTATATPIPKTLPTLDTTSTPVTAGATRTRARTGAPWERGYRRIARCRKYRSPNAFPGPGRVCVFRRKYVRFWSPGPRGPAPFSISAWVHDGSKTASRNSTLLPQLTPLARRLPLSAPDA